MAEVLLDPIPFYGPLLQDGTDPVSNVWFRWLEQLLERIAVSAARIDTYATATVETAALGTTNLGITSAGIYQISWTLRITRAATTSSSLQVGVTYTDDGITVSQSGAAATGNTVTTVQSGVVIVETDANSPVTFATTYASVGGTSMQYKIAVQAVKLV